MSFKIWKIIAHLGFSVQYPTKTNQDLLCCTWTRTTCEISGQDYPMHLALEEIQISSLWMEIVEFHVTTACVSKLDSNTIFGETWYYIPYPCTMKGLCLGQTCSILPTYMEIKNLTTPTDMKDRNQKNTKHSLKTTNISSSHIVNQSLTRFLDISQLRSVFVQPFSPFQHHEENSLWNELGIGWKHFIRTKQYPLAIKVKTLQALLGGMIFVGLSDDSCNLGIFCPILKAPKTVTLFESSPI